MIYILAGVAVLFVVAMRAAAKPNVGGNSDAIISVITGKPVAQTPQTQMSQSTTQTDTAPLQYGPTLEQLGARPALFVTGNSPTTGAISFITKFASSVRGIGIDGAVLFDKPILRDGPNSAIYPAGSIVDHINVHGSGGDATVQVYVPIEDTTMTSAGIRDSSIITNQNTADLQWPADDVTPASPFQTVEA